MNAADGSAVWTIAGCLSSPGVASDGEYVYANGCASYSNPRIDNRLYRVHAANGAPAAFAGKQNGLRSLCEFDRRIPRADCGP